MSRLFTVVIALAMAIIAGSVGVVLYRLMGVGGLASSSISVALFLTFVLSEFMQFRVREHKSIHQRIDDLSQLTTSVARDVQGLEARLYANERDLDGKIDRVIQPLDTDIEALGTVVRQLTEAVTEIDSRFAAHSTPVSHKPDDKANIEYMNVLGNDVVLDDMDEMRAILRHAIDNNQIEIHLQPIVSLPQRKVCYYEAITYIRADDGTLLEPALFMPVAERVGLMPELDRVTIIRSMHILRRLNRRNHGLGIFCSISVDGFCDNYHFDEISAFLEKNKDLAGSLVMQIGQSEVRSMGPIEMEAMAELVDLGFHFSMINLTDLRADFHELAKRGFRHFKIPATLMLDETQTIGGDIHMADLADLLGRHGVELIVDTVRTETDVIHLLEFKVPYAQGLLFAPPRPVRSDRQVESEPNHKEKHEDVFPQARQA